MQYAIRKYAMPNTCKGKGLKTCNRQMQMGW